MIIRFAAFLLSITIPSIPLATFFDAYVSKEKKKQIMSMLEVAWIKLDDTDVRIVAQAPIHFLITTFDLLFGNRSTTPLVHQTSANQLLLICTW